MSFLIASGGRWVVHQHLFWSSQAFESPDAGSLPAKKSLVGGRAFLLLSLWIVHECTPVNISTKTILLRFVYSSYLCGPKGIVGTINNHNDEMMAVFLRPTHFFTACSTSYNQHLNVEYFNIFLNVPTYLVVI